MSEIRRGKFGYVSTFLSDVTHTLILELRFWRIFWIDATNDETIKFSYQMIAGYPEATASGVKDIDRKSVV